MQVLTWTYMDKTGWGAGAWSGEPDKKQWPDPATGLPCLITRNPLGHLHGWVGVPEGHPWHGAAADAVDPPPEVHGHLTETRPPEAKGPYQWAMDYQHDEGDPDVWWVGFDCGHLHDLAPAMQQLEGLSRRTYRDLAYVEKHCGWLAYQAAAAATRGVTA
jgi:hypothetical protein